jgi:hypothetical protein
MRVFLLLLMATPALAAPAQIPPPVSILGFEMKSDGPKTSGPLTATCSQWVKQKDGRYVAPQSANYSFEGAAVSNFKGYVWPGKINVGGVDLYGALDTLCSPSKLGVERATVSSDPGAHVGKDTGVVVSRPNPRAHFDDTVPLANRP